MRNNFEEKIYGELVKRFGKANVSYESLKLPYVEEKTYTPDFVVLTNDGKIIIETKGYFRPKDRRLMRLIKDQHNDKDIRMLFYSNSKIGKAMRCSEWAERNGFVYAIGNVPTDW